MSEYQKFIAALLLFCPQYARNAVFIEPSGPDPGMGTGIPCFSAILIISVPGRKYKPWSCSSKGRRSSVHSSNVCLRSEEHTSELQSRENLVCRLLLENKKR